ncbi:hypothetical protein ACSZNT_17425 [Aeromonas veronii]
MRLIPLLALWLFLACQSALAAPGRVYSLAANSQLYDATAVWMHKTEREQDFLFSEAVLQEQFVFFSLKSRQLQAERLSRSSACGWGAISPTATGPSWTRWWPMAR